MAPAVLPVTIDEPAQIYEDRHVHAVYDQIANHFSSTRYKVGNLSSMINHVFLKEREKPWPIIAGFLSAIPRGSIGLDSGTGNGKYLPLPIDRPGQIWTIGLDRSRNLLEIARSAGAVGPAREVVQGDALNGCWRPGIFVS